MMRRKGHHCNQAFSKSRVWTGTANRPSCFLLTKLLSREKPHVCEVHCGRACRDHDACRCCVCADADSNDRSGEYGVDHGVRVFVAGYYLAQLEGGWPEGLQRPERECRVDR